MSDTPDPQRGRRSDLFDPKAVRYFSFLPDEDADEAYCIRHDREMAQIIPTIHTQEALFTTAPEFTVYTCPECRADIDRLEEAGVGKRLFDRALSQAFKQWDDGDALADWFQYICEGTMEEVDGEKVAIPGSGWSDE